MTKTLSPMIQQNRLLHLIWNWKMTLFQRVRSILITPISWLQLPTIMF